MDLLQLEHFLAVVAKANSARLDQIEEGGVVFDPSTQALLKAAGIEG